VGPSLSAHDQECFEAVRALNIIFVKEHRGNQEMKHRSFQQGEARKIDDFKELLLKHKHTHK
jgi:hypothetical protein